jgi:hypothetical protein
MALVTQVESGPALFCGDSCTAPLLANEPQKPGVTPSIVPPARVVAERHRLCTFAQRATIRRATVMYERTAPEPRYSRRCGDAAVDRPVGSGGYRRDWDARRFAGAASARNPAGVVAPFGASRRARSRLERANPPPTFRTGRGLECVEWTDTLRTLTGARHKEGSNVEGHIDEERAKETQEETLAISIVKERDMGDKGGKKDKEKNRQQQVKKQKQEEQRKQDKAQPRTP